MFEGLKDVGKLLKDAKKMKSEMSEIQKELKNTNVEGKNRNGTVTITMTGDLLVTDVNIDESLLTAGNQKALQSAIKDAVNDASEKSKKLAAGRLSHLSKGLNLPGM